MNRVIFNKFTYIYVLLLFFRIVKTKMVKVDFKPRRFHWFVHEPRPYFSFAHLLDLELNVPICNSVFAVL